MLDLVVVKKLFERSIVIGLFAKEARIKLFDGLGREVTDFGNRFATDDLTLQLPGHISLMYLWVQSDNLVQTIPLRLR
jgi:hypothetical protein